MWRPSRRVPSRVVRGDIRDPESLVEACRGAHVVVHCAGLVTDWAPRSAFMAVNAQGSRNLAEAAAAAGAARLVHMSTTDVYGFPDRNGLDEDTPLRSRGWGYPDSKIAAERAVQEVAARTGLDPPCDGVRAARQGFRSRAW